MENRENGRMRMEREEPKGERKGGGKFEDVMIGRNAVSEALRVGRQIDSILVARGSRTGSLSVITARAREKGIPVKEVDSKKLDHLCGGANHQGVAAIAAVKEYVSLDQLFQKAEEKGEAPFFILCDELEDPHNLGAILRTAECAGAHGVIIPKRRSAGLTAIVGKTSAGAVSYMPVARVANLPATLEELKKKGVWVYGTAAEGTTSLYDADLKGPAAIVIGSEGSGMGRLVREKCDFLVSIPMKGHISSLNASAAAAILLYEAVRRRM